MIPRGLTRVLLASAVLMPVPVAADTTALSEVTITARKVRENLQDVPVSVKVLGAGFLADADQSHLFNLQFHVPGLLVNNIGVFGAGLSLRGVSDQAGTGQAVATHVNGVYLGDPQLAISRLYELERIEVLKGPQGTLYGRNATGGSINIITRPPEASSGASIEGAYGSFSTARAQGRADLQVQDAAIGLAFITSEGDGYIRNSVDDRKFAENDFWGMRASAQFSLGSEVHADFMAQHTEDDGATGELWTPNPEFLANPRDIRLATVTLPNTFLDLRNDIVTLNFAYELGIGTLVSTTGYARSRVRNRDDCAGTPMLQGCVRGERDGRFRQWSQELQLRLPKTRTLEGLVGLYYYEDDQDSDFYQYAPLFSPDPIFDRRQTAANTAAAVFGQVTLSPAERWRLTGGLRLSREEQRLTTIGSGVLDSPTLLVGRLDSSDDAWRLDMTYAANPELRLYASVSTGFKSGGFTRELQDQELDDFGPESLIAYEAGLKSQSQDRRWMLNAAAFHYDYRDLQVTTIGSGGLTDVDNAAKAQLYGIDTEASVQVTDRIGISAGAVWMPKREFTEYLDMADDDSVQDYSGNKLVRAPKLSATVAIDGSRPLPGRGMLSARVEYDYRGPYFFTKENSPNFAQDAFGLLHAFVKFESPDVRWYLFASVHNLMDEDYFNQIFLQSSPGLPRTWEFGAGYRL